MTVLEHRRKKMPYSYVYILASRKNGTLYVGVTSDLIKRIGQHKSWQISGFANKYKVNKLMYFEQFENISEAIKREKQLKGWRRDWKLKLIEDNNPKCEDLYDSIV